MTNNKFNKIAIIALATALFGQVYLNPFNTDFRISIGIVVLTLLLIKFKNTPIIITTIITGLVVVVFRVLLGYIAGQNFISLIEIHLPAFFFYLSYGILLKMFSVREIVKQPILLITFLTFSDVLSNIIEASIRYEYHNVSAKIVISSLLTAGLLRASIVFILNLGLIFYSIVILKDENNMRIKEFLVLASKMKTESFFLKKSMNDVEKAMNKSYYLYNQFNSLDFQNISIKDTNDLKEEILELTKDIHELKKDNERVVVSIEKIIPKNTQLDEMQLDEIISMLKENTENLAEMSNKDIKINASIVNKKLVISDYYPLITVLINLLSNAVDAINQYGVISITQIENKEWLILQITDNGKGINTTERDIIFKPGYSTKYDKKTGQMSGGIGLTHVKAMIEDYYEGNIEMISNESQGTRFQIEILKSKL
ncbi:MAG: GHKL domain-containing protein [Clostridiales bacterium]|nr:GHKL domain-containing protein [Clostridiales bacterium]